MRAYGAGGVPGGDDGLGAEDVRDEVAADPRVLHLERHVELRPAVPRLRGGAALARLPAAARRPAARRLGAEAVDALGPRRPHGYQHKRGSSTSASTRRAGVELGVVVLVEEEVLMEGGRSDWGECNRESDGSGAVEPGASESARSGSGRGPARRG